MAELTRQATQQGLRIADLLPRELWEVSTVEPIAVLDLTDPETLQHLSLAHSDLIRNDFRPTQQIGQAAHDAGYRAIRSPSATGIDVVHAVFCHELEMPLQSSLIETWTAPHQL